MTLILNGEVGDFMIRKCFYISYLKIFQNVKIVQNISNASCPENK